MKAQSLPKRVYGFLEDFLPQNAVQLSFPLASFILYVGTSSWLPPRHTFYNLLFQQATKKLGFTDLWFNVSSIPALLRYDVAIWAAYLAFFASVVLWCLPLRNVLRKFAVWVFLPIVLAVVYFLALVLISRSPDASLLTPSSQIVSEQLHMFPSRLLLLGRGFYVTLFGVFAIALCLWAYHKGKINLPLRPRGMPTSRDGDHGLAQRVFIVLAISTAFAVIAIGTVEGIIAVAYPVSRLGRWPANFSVILWGPALAAAILTAICAIGVLHPDTGKPSIRRWNKQLAGSILFAFVLGLAVVIGPRLALTGSSSAPLFDFDYPSRLPIAFLGMDLPRPSLWILVVYLIALLQEFVLRGCLQACLMRRFGLKRAIFLVALLWWMLPLYFGLDSGSGLRVLWPGARAIFFIALCLIYSVPLGWLYARFNSILPSTVMLGTILLFHEGDTTGAYFTHPVLYWIELALLIVVGSLLFKFYPPAEPRSAPRHALDALPPVIL